MDYQKRNDILGVDTSGDYTPIPEMSLDTLKQLEAAALLDPEETQNDSPSIREFMEFMRIHPGVTAHGYTIGGNRTDARVSIEGLHYSGVMTLEFAAEVANRFHFADEFEISVNGFRIWWD